MCFFKWKIRGEGELVIMGWLNGIIRLMGYRVLRLGILGLLWLVMIVLGCLICLGISCLLSVIVVVSLLWQHMKIYLY